jgi:hypothetical protein
MAIEVSRSKSRRFQGKDTERLRIEVNAIVTWEFREDSQQISKIQEENRKNHWGSSGYSKKVKVEEMELYWVEITLTNGKEMSLGRTNREEALAIVKIIDREKKHREREMDIFTEAKLSLRGKKLSEKTGIV